MLKMMPLATTKFSIVLTQCREIKKPGYTFCRIPQFFELALPFVGLIDQPLLPYLYGGYLAPVCAPWRATPLFILDLNNHVCYLTIKEAFYFIFSDLKWVTS
jgi:hypothetical protein